MECMSCQSAINPKWKFAIEQNSCPCCGEKIMEEELKNLLSSLSVSITSLKENYDQQLDDWMLANFNYIKTDSPNLKDYLPKELFRSSTVKEKNITVDEHDSSEDEELVQKVSDENAAKFFKNAGVEKHVKKTDELKQLIQKIKSDNPGIAAAVHSEVEEDLESYPEENYSNSNYEEEIPASVLAFANQSNRQNPNYNPKDMARLQQLQQRTMDSRRNVVNGTGGKGSFSRSS